MQTTVAHLHDPLRAYDAIPLLPPNESPDDSVGDGESGVCSHGLKNDGTSDACVDFNGFPLDVHTAHQWIASLKVPLSTGEPAAANITTLRITNAPHLPVDVLLELIKVVTDAGARLVHVDVSRNDLGDEVVEGLAATLTPALRTLDLAGNHLSETATATLLKALRGSGAAVERLDLSHNHLGQKASATLGELLQSPPWSSSMRELVLAHCGLNDTTAPAVAEGVHAATALERLDVSHNAYSLSLASPLSPMRPVTLPATLRMLNLSGILFKSVLLRGLAASMLPCVDGLEELRMSACLEGDDALQLLFAQLRSLPSLTVLDVSRCRLTYRCAKMLGQKLIVFGKLERVDLSHNLLDVEGVADLSSGLSRMKHLTSLRLEGCHLGNCGAVSVVNSVAHGAAPLRQMDLSDNGITDVGMRDVCTQLSRDTSPKLDLLILSRNPCTLQSRAQVEGMMQEHQSDCVVVARETPLDDITSASSTAFNSEAASLAE